MKTLIILNSIADLLDVVSIELEQQTLCRNEKLDDIRCLLEDFKEDLGAQYINNKEVS
jgi:hypothetical protein